MWYLPLPSDDRLEEDLLEDDEDCFGIATGEAGREGGTVTASLPSGSAPRERIERSEDAGNEDRLEGGAGGRLPLRLLIVLSTLSETVNWKAGCWVEGRGTSATLEAPSTLDSSRESRERLDEAGKEDRLEGGAGGRFPLLLFSLVEEEMASLSEGVVVSLDLGAS